MGRVRGSDAQKKTKNAEENWAAAAARLADEFDRQKASLLHRKNNYDEIETQRQEELKQMLAMARENQFAVPLSQHLIKQAAIPNIGPSLKEKLTASGIITALDVGRIRWPKGFGDARQAFLVEWRRNVEATVIFKIAKAIPPHETQALESKYEYLRQPIQPGQTHHELKD